jgi:hypothetical protein
MARAAAGTSLPPRGCPLQKMGIEHMVDDPAESERLMLGMLREWNGKDDCRMTLEFQNGAWETKKLGCAARQGSFCAWCRADV